MSNDKRYYWLKLSESFFEDDTIAWIKDQESGNDYLIFYLQLCLKSLQNDGNLIRYVGEKLIPYDDKSLAKLTNTELNIVTKAMKAFKDIGIIQVKDTGEIYLSQINEMIGSETDSARRMRKKRLLDNKRKELIQELIDKPSQCANNVQKCDTEIEKDIELEIEKDIELEIESETETDILSVSDETDDASLDEKIPYKEIIDYLNKKTNSQFRYTTKKNKELIKERWAEGNTLEDFRRVIDIKVAEWLDDSKMNKYLRPQTLFGTNFECYLNQSTERTNNSYAGIEF